MRLHCELWRFIQFSKCCKLASFFTPGIKTKTFLLGQARGKLNAITLEAKVDDWKGQIHRISIIIQCLHFGAIEHSQLYWRKTNKVESIHIIVIQNDIHIRCFGYPGLSYQLLMVSSVINPSLAYTMGLASLALERVLLVLIVRVGILMARVITLSFHVAFEVSQIVAKY